MNFNIYSVHLKRVNLRVSSHCVVVGRYDVDCVITDKHCDVDVLRLTRPDSFPDQTAKGQSDAGCLGWFSDTLGKGRRRL